MKIGAGVLVLMILISGALYSQQLDESKASQAVKNQLSKLRNEIQKKQYSFQVGYSEAMNLSLTELCGLRVPDHWQATAKIKNLGELKPQTLRNEGFTLPPIWDWREHNGVTAIRNQGSCGSCWAFATIGAFESLLKLKADTTVDLSEQHLVSCNEEGWGCNGGFWAFDMLVASGAVMEKDFPYVASDVRCGGPYTHPFLLSGWSYINGEDEIPEVQLIKEAIFQYGPISAAVYVGTAFQAYTGGVFDKDESKSSGWLNCSAAAKEPNHGIMLVGWDDEKNSWILKNSWGPSWGEHGYMYIQYGISLVGYAAAVVY